MAWPLTERPAPSDSLYLQEMWIGALRTAGSATYTFVNNQPIPQVDGLNVNDYFQLVEPACLEE